jgi:integrase
LASVSIRRRPGKRGVSFQVRYRLGGRAYPYVHGGAFPTLREARLRRDLIAGELAAGRNPAGALRVERPRVKTLAEWAADWRASRRNVSDGTKRNLAIHLGSILPVLGEREPATLTFSDVTVWVETMQGKLAPGTLRAYMGTLRKLLDYVGCDPNPARDRRVELPRIEVEEPNPPTARQFAALLAAALPARRLALVLMEQTGMRVGEVVSLAWGDVDVAEAKIRLRRRNVKTSRPRIVQVPPWLMDRIAATCPLEDRTAERRVFPGCAENGYGKVIARACKLAGIPHFHPHDLRDRRASIWHHEGVPLREVAARIGHSKPSMTLDVYTAVLDPGAAPVERLEALLDA